MIRIVFLLAGIAFGYILIVSGVSNYDIIRKMFLFQEFHMYGLLGVAVITSFVGVSLWRKLNKKPLFAEDTDWHIEKLDKAHVIGGLLSGVGWALTGACPGPSLALLGFGALSAIFIVTGIFLGTYLFAVIDERKNSP